MLRVIRNELAKSFAFSGRTSRRVYLQFLALSIASFSISVWITLSVFPEGMWAAIACVIVAIFYFPVTAAGVRRLHDVGESGVLMLNPLKPAICFALLGGLAWLSMSSSYSLGMAALFSAMFFGSILAAIAAIAALVASFMTVAFFSNTMGLLLLPSQPGPNKYGPNPNEVPQ